MELILLKNVEKVGRKFEIVKVKNGYGRNYLIPQGLAVIANKTNRNNLDSYKRQEAAKLEKLLDTFQEIADKVKGHTLNIPVKCGTSGKIFGSVTTLQLSKALKEQLDVDVDRRDILLPDEAKMIGTYTATLDLHPDGSFDYMPYAGFTGTDNFTYRAADGAAQSGPATVIITVDRRCCPFEKIYGENSAETKLLRRYRDEVLAGTAAGRAAIRLYYRTAPLTEKMVAGSGTVKQAAKALLDRLLPWIEERLDR